MRKLADFAFMLRDWKLAHSVYDLLRTDFTNDKAWKYHAAAHVRNHACIVQFMKIDTPQEMTAVSLILTSTSLTHKIRQETIDPMIDLACYSYIARCSATYSALRCLLVSVELLRLRGGGAVDEAAKWAMRARESNSLGPIGHALVTERVGDCYVMRQGRGSQALGSRKRKAAMWKMLAANEWVTAGKSTRARHCLDDALPRYEDTKFDAIKGFSDSLKTRTGYTPLTGRNVGNLVDDDCEDGERLELGSKRKSIVISPSAVEDSRAAEDDHFVES